MDAALLIVIGVWIFTQVFLGGLVDRLKGYTNPQNPASPAGLGGSALGTTTATRSRGSGRGRVRVGRDVKRGERYVLERLRHSAAKAGVDLTVTSWLRHRATVSGTTRPSCHASGRAIDCVPTSGDFAELDILEAQLHDDLDGSGLEHEIIYRGYAGHDPALTDDEDGPHLHLGIKCGGDR